MADAEVFNLAELLVDRTLADRPYSEFLRVPALSAGLYELAAGATDTQNPHREAEVYYVIAGRADFRAGTRITPLKPDSIIHVAAGVDHRFENITENLLLLVIFAPAETK